MEKDNKHNRDMEKANKRNADQGKRKTKDGYVESHHPNFILLGLNTIGWNQGDHPVCWIVALCDWLSNMERICHGRSPYYKATDYSPQDVINYFHLVSDLVDKDGKKLGVSSRYFVHKAIEFISKFGLPPLEASPFHGVVNADNPNNVAWMFRRSHIRNFPLKTDYDHYTLINYKGSHFYKHNNSVHHKSSDSFIAIVEQSLKRCDILIATFCIGHYFHTIKSSWEIYDQEKEFTFEMLPVYRHWESATLRVVAEKEKDCSQWWNMFNPKEYHSMQIVGCSMDEISKRPYLEIKNSHGPLWGILGFGRIYINQEKFPILSMTLPKFNYCLCGQHQD